MAQPHVGTVVVVVIAAAISSIIIGAATSFGTLFTSKVDIEELPAEPVMEDSAISNVSIYWSFAGFTFLLGLILMLAPPWFFGPSWSYFDQLPHNGFFMGVVCATLGSLQCLTLWRLGPQQHGVLSLLFFLSGFVFWVAGIILGAEGLLGHQGLMEAPFMMYVGAHKFAHSAALSAQAHVPTWILLTRSKIRASIAIVRRYCER